MAGLGTVSDWNQRHARSCFLVFPSAEVTPIGIRTNRLTEATWGADPLEYIGGFPSLQPSFDARFRSSLPADGTARWNITTASQTSASPEAANATLSISYSNVDWNFLKIVYGWAAVQYQCWARGSLTVTGNDIQHVILYTDAILEFWIDGRHYFGGDFFTFRNAPPVLHLAPGTHQVSLRLVRDVRAFGGISAPTIDVFVHAERVSGSLELAKSGILMSDVVDGRLASPVGSVVLRNTGEEDVEVVGIQPSHVRSPFSLQRLGSQAVLDDVYAEASQFLTASQTQSPSNESSGIVIAAGQTRPLAFNVSLPLSNVSSLTYRVIYKAQSSGQSFTLEVTQKLTKTSIYEPHKVTFLHPGGMASYTMLRPPAQNITCASGSNSSLPVVLSLHGAGLEADNGQVAHALDPVPDLCAWVSN